MTNEDFIVNFELLEAVHDAKKEGLKAKFIAANNPYNVGDIISDQFKSIQIRKFELLIYYRNYNNKAILEIVYHGYKIKKDGTPDKKSKMLEVWKSNII